MHLPEAMVSSRSHDMTLYLLLGLIVSLMTVRGQTICKLLANDQGSETCSSCMTYLPTLLDCSCHADNHDSGYLGLAV